MKKISIIGSGIGGLTTAIALQQKGFEVELFDQAECLKPVGAGIFLANNAMQVYKSLGLDKTISQSGFPVSQLKVTKSDLSTLTAMDLSDFEKRYKVKNTAIHRHVLQDILIKALKPETKLHFGHRLQSIENFDTHSELHFENGKTHNANWIIGGDGIHSSTRKFVLEKEAQIRNANQICWRAVVDFELPDEFSSEMIESWGRGRRFGFSYISNNTVYWFALINKDLNENKPVQSYFQYFHPLVNQLINAANESQIHKSDILDLKPINTWSKGNICLIGDAAHATTPNLGQGACQAIEDAFYLAQFMDKYKSDKAFEAFETFRKKKVLSVVNTSWKLGKMAQLSNPLLTFARNSALKLTPDSISKKQSAAMFELAEID